MRYQKLGFGIRKHMHLLAASILAVAAGLTVWYYMEISAPSVSVVVATRMLASGTTISREDITEKRAPKSMVPPDAVKDRDSVLGKVLMQGDILPGDMVRQQRLSSNKGSGLTARLAVLAPGKQACDLPLETAPGLYGLLEGDRVDVYTEIAAGKGTGSTDTEGPAVIRVASGAVILGIPTGGGRMSRSMSGPEESLAYIIAVKPEEAGKLAQGIVQGKKFSIMLLPGETVDK